MFLHGICESAQVVTVPMHITTICNLQMVTDLRSVPGRAFQSQDIREALFFGTEHRIAGGIYFRSDYILGGAGASDNPIKAVHHPLRL